MQLPAVGLNSILRYPYLKRDADIFLEVPETPQHKPHTHRPFSEGTVISCFRCQKIQKVINTEMFNKDLMSLPSRNDQGEEMFANPMEKDDKTTEEFLKAQSSMSTWGMADINKGPLTTVGSMELPSIPTHAQAFHQVGPSYCESYSTNKRMAMTTPGGSNDSSTHHASKKIVLEYWQDPQGGGEEGATQMEMQGTLSGREDVVMDSNGAEMDTKKITTTTQLHNEQEMMIKMAQAFGIDMAGDDAQQKMEEFLNTPITTLGSVLKLMTTFHTKITQVEIKAQAMTVEVMLDIFGDKIVSMHKELTWLGKEHRTTQKQRASVQVVLSGWPNNCSPDERNGFIRWMCRECKDLKKLLMEWYKYDVDDKQELITHILQVPPTTLSFKQRFGQIKYGPITILTFTNFDARQAFLNTYMGWQPHYEWSDNQRTNNKIRSAPASPDFQRQLEVPLRTVHKVLNTAPRTKGKQFITLWKTLTVMEPQDTFKYIEDHKACFKLEYTVHKNTGDVMAEMHITQELSDMMKMKFDTATQKVVEDSLMVNNTLWQSCWNNQVTGRDQEIGAATGEANRTVREEGAYTTGTHWSQEFTKYTNTLFPFKIKLIVYPNDMDIDYDNTEYNKKMKNVSRNTDEREKNTGKDSHNAGGGWHQQGAVSQSSTGVSPTDGNAPTATQAIAKAAADYKDETDKAAAEYVENEKKKAEEAFRQQQQKIEKDAEDWKQQQQKKAEDFHGQQCLTVAESTYLKTNTEPPRPPGMPAMMPPPGNHQWPPAGGSQGPSGVMTSQPLDATTLQPATNTGPLPEGEWHQKDDKESAPWKGYESFSAPSAQGKGGKVE